MKGRRYAVVAVAVGVDVDVNRLLEAVMWETERRATTAAGDDAAVCAGPRPAWARARRMGKDLALCIVTSIDGIGIEVDFFCSGPRVYECWGGSAGAGASAPLQFKARY